MHSKGITLFFAMMIGVFNSAIAQDDPSILKANMVPASPEAAMLFKFQDIPVSKYTGTADITIPLVNVESPGISWPISLNYHTSGNKVGDVASYAGLGWRLNATGMISRKVRGLPDDKPRGKLRTPNWRNNIYRWASNFGYPENWTILTGIMNQQYDGESDEFYFSFNGYSGKMAFRDTSNDNPVEPLVVSCNIPVKVNYWLGNSGIYKWSITTPDGLMYIFAALEKIRTEVQRAPAPPTSCNVALPWEEFVSSWYLTEIVNVNGFTTHIMFTYDDYNTDYEWVRTWTETHTAWSGNICAIPFPNTETHLQRSDTKSRTFIKGKKIKQIFFAGNKTYVDFIYNNPRQDLPSTLNDRSLDRIVVSRKTGADNAPHKTIEERAFRYFYQGNRLMLRSVQQVSTDSSISIPPYEFEYNGLSLPDRLTGREQIDHWGYYNNGTKLLPAFDEVNFPGRNYVNLPGGSDRDPDLARTKAQVLEKVIYPTGGSTTLEYEQNAYSFIQDQSLESQNLYVLDDTMHTVSVIGQGDQYAVVSRIIDITSISGRATIDASADIADCWEENGNIFCGSRKFPKVTLYKWNPVSNQYESIFFVQTNIADTSFSNRLDLLPGTYKLEVQAALRLGPGRRGDEITANLSYHYEKQEKIVEKKAGGLRVKKIKDYDPVARITHVRSFDYNMTSGNRYLSSGVIYGEPVYAYITYPIHTVPGSPTEIYCISQTIFGSSAIVLGETAGSPIGYQQVTDWEEYKGQPNGKTVTAYSSPFIYPDRITRVKPFGSPESFSFKTGLILNEKAYNNAGVIVKEDEFEYAFKQYEFLGAQASKGIAECPCPNTNDLTICRAGSILDIDHDGWNDFLAAANNRLIIGTAKLKKEVHTQDGFRVEKIYEYDSSLHMEKRIVVRNNELDKDSIIMTYKHPGDEAGMDGLTSQELIAINSMKEKGMTNYVLEEKKHRQNTDIIRVRNHFNNINAPGDTRSVLSGVSIQNGNGPLERRQEIELYDNVGNVLQQRKTNDLPYSYIWDLASGNPAAEATNSTYNNIAFSSFEADNSNGSGWQIGASQTYQRNTFGLTGNYCYNLINGNITKTGLEPGKKYVITYWSKNGPYNVNGITPVAGRTNGLGWTYYEHITGATTNSVTISGTGLIDELRLHPDDAEMTSYTYEPGVGILSKNTEDNIISYYEYDGLNRLKLVRDQDGNILEMTEYKYQVQERNMVPDWKDAVPAVTRCEKGSDLGAGNNYNTGYTLRKQIDVNPYSPTFNQQKWVRISLDSNVCPVVADWQYIGYQCTTDACGNRTGDYKNMLQDKNPYSVTFNQTILSGGGTSTQTCPVPAPCTEEGYRLINNACVRGQKVVVSFEEADCRRTEVYYYIWTCGQQSRNYTKVTPIPNCTGQ
jgi:hypothetical protein